MVVSLRAESADGGERATTSEMGAAKVGFRRAMTKSSEEGGLTHGRGGVRTHGTRAGAGAVIPMLASELEARPGERR